MSPSSIDSIAFLPRQLISLGRIRLPGHRVCANPETLMLMLMLLIAAEAAAVDAAGSQYKGRLHVYGGNAVRIV